MILWETATCRDVSRQTESQQIPYNVPDDVCDTCIQLQRPYLVLEISRCYVLKDQRHFVQQYNAIKHDAWQLNEQLVKFFQNILCPLSSMTYYLLCCYVCCCRRDLAVLLLHAGQPSAAAAELTAYFDSVKSSGAAADPFDMKLANDLWKLISQDNNVTPDRWGAGNSSCCCCCC